MYACYCVTMYIVNNVYNCILCQKRAPGKIGLKTSWTSSLNNFFIIIIIFIIIINAEIKMEILLAQTENQTLAEIHPISSQEHLI